MFVEKYLSAIENIMLLNRDELYEKLETAILNLPKRTFLNYREPLNIRLYEKD